MNRGEAELDEAEGQVNGDIKCTIWALMIEHPALIETSSVGMVEVDMWDVWIHICCKLQNLTEREKPVTILQPASSYL